MNLHIPRLKFFIFTALVVTGLGVCNELLELTLQTFTPLIFATTVTDTWLDLASNTFGILAAAVCFVPRIKPR